MFCAQCHGCRETIIMVFTLGLLMRAFFGWGKLFVCHSSLCRLVSVSLSNTHDSSSVITLCKKFGSISSLPSKSWQISNRFAFPSTDKFFGTNFAQIFRMCKCSVRILWTAFIFKPVSSAIILTLNRWSFAITARTTSTFWLFVDEIGLPERGSSSTFSRSPLKVSCHLKTQFSIEWHFHKLRLKKQMSLWKICWVSHKIW